jgi:hypothetical protein
VSTVIFNASTGDSLEVLLGETSPKITDGYANWSVIDRPKRKGITQYQGRNPVQQTIPVIFDGWVDDESQEDSILLMESFAEAGDLAEPPKITLQGHALRKDLTWIITAISWDDNNAIWEDAGGNNPFRVRLSGVITLTQYIVDNVLATATSPDPNPKNRKVRVSVQGGMTWKQLAQLYYGDASKWYIIADANPQISPDTRQKVPAGTVIWIPSLTTAPGKRVTVN